MTRRRRYDYVKRLKSDLLDKRFCRLALCAMLGAVLPRNGSVSQKVKRSWVSGHRGKFQVTL